MIRLSPPWHKVAILKLLQGCDKVVARLSQGCHNAPCHKLGTTLYFETVAKLLQGGGKAVTKVLSQLCIVVTSL